VVFGIPAHAGFSGRAETVSRYIQGENREQTGWTHENKLCACDKELLSGPLCAQPNETPPAFEAADVHVSPHRMFPLFEGGRLRGDRYVLRQVTMVDLITTAYSTG
jgi:hypothetical protein